MPTIYTGTSQYLILCWAQRNVVGVAPRVQELFPVHVRGRSLGKAAQQGRIFGIDRRGLRPSYWLDVNVILVASCSAGWLSSFLQKHVMRSQRTLFGILDAMPQAFKWGKQSLVTQGVWKPRSRVGASHSLCRCNG